MDTPWTRLKGSDLWRGAAAKYADNNLPFHNFDHVGRLYYWAAVTRTPYSERLDENILGHDVIQDLGPGLNERASAQWLMSTTGRAESAWSVEEMDWADPILCTIEHRPSEDTTGLAMLDLMDFVDPFVTRSNTERLRLEAIKSKGGAFNQRVWLKGNMEYLSGLSERIRTDLPGLAGDKLQNWTRIARGIAVTLACAPARYDPHPAQGIQRYTQGMEAALRLCAGSEEPQTMQELVSIGAEFPVGERDPFRAAARHISGLEHVGLISRQSSRGADAVWRPTDAGRDWVERMNADHPEYPEPDFPQPA